jgi:hypothetical protein
MWILSAAGALRGLLYTHVDDLFVVGAAVSAEALIVELEGVLELKRTTPTHYLGMDLAYFADRIELSRTRYISAEFGGDWVRAACPTVPLPLTVLQEGDDSALLPAAEKREYQRLMGKLIYAAQLRADLSFAVSYHGRACSAPTVRALRLLCHTLTYLAHTASLPLHFPIYAAHGHASLRLWCDANLGNCLPGRSPHAQTGFIAVVNGCPVLWRSNKQRHVARSSTKAELNACYEALDRVLLLLAFLAEAGLKTTACVYTDSRNLVDLLEAPHPTPTEVHLAIQLRRMQQLLALDAKALADIAFAAYALRDLRSFLPDAIQVCHVPGLTNPADGFTKPLDTAVLLYDRLLALEPSSSLARGGDLL